MSIYSILYCAQYYHSIVIGNDAMAHLALRCIMTI